MASTRPSAYEVAQAHAGLRGWSESLTASPKSGPAALFTDTTTPGASSDDCTPMPLPQGPALRSSALEDHPGSLGPHLPSAASGIRSQAMEPGKLRFQVLAVGLAPRPPPARGRLLHTGRRRGLPRALGHRSFCSNFFQQEVTLRPGVRVEACPPSQDDALRDLPGVGATL